MNAWNPEGRSRGVALFWRRGVDVTLRSYGRRHVDVDVTEEGGMVWRLTGVYGESEAGRKKETWRALKLLGQHHQRGRLWLCVGDFNEILSCDEKEGGAARTQRCMDDFREALDSCELTDIGYIGDKFTWRNHSRDLNTYIRERLDRATANAYWCEVSPDFSVINGYPRHSDHRPVIIQTSGARPGVRNEGRTFQFEAWWLQEEGCSEVIGEAWEAGLYGGQGGVSAAMKNVATLVEKEAKEVVGEIEGRLKKARKDLERCMRCPVSEEKIAEEARLRCVVNDLEEKKNTKEKQRSRVSWLKDGNRNTRYFMAFASARRKMNRVKELKKEDGSVVKEGEELTNYICSYFQDLFTSRTGNRLHELIDKVEPRITTPMHAVLDAEFTREEVKAALDHIGDLKAPGPDGMPSILYKKHWHFMGDRVVDEVLAVLNGGPIPEGWNETIVVLIPKVRTPSRIKDLRPISLCNVIYKLVSKVIANRLKIILPDIISDNQSAFVPGRLITDNVLIAYELSHFLLGRKKGKEDFAAVKADMSKAYDRVEWSFLEAMLGKLGFKQCWVDLIMKCVSSVKYQINVNGAL
uniref:Reverse transcriptase domain-containing protein n=1 Tax=Aegilops tauschii subsp. strangulata TaxID=200361 RepID=A0A453D5J8_AEGTS